MTEGAKTEPNYLKKLCDRLKLSTTDVEILHPNGTDPITLTNKAIELRNARKKRAKKGLAIDYDEVWVVFDLEKPHDERRKLAVAAMALRDVGSIKFAVSNPCFEFWLLLHEEYTTAPFPDCDSVIKRLIKQWPGYSKGQSPDLAFLEKIPVAVTHAKRCRKHHEDSAGDGNPSTQVDLLTRSLNTATRPYLQLKLA